MALPGEMGAWAVLCSGGHSAPGLVSTSQSLTPYLKGLWLERPPQQKGWTAPEGPAFSFPVENHHNSCPQQGLHRGPHLAEWPGGGHWTAAPPGLPAGK